MLILSFSSLFQVTNFPNDECAASNGLNGTCLSGVSSKSKISHLLCPVPYCTVLLYRAVPYCTILYIVHYQSECSGLGGLSSGSCALGFGTCCVLSSSTCGGTVARNLTYIRSPGYPSPYTSPGTCSWTVNSADNICKIRLDFQNMEVADPDSNEPRVVELSN